jgi:hypothetical protein
MSKHTWYQVNDTIINYNWMPFNEKLIDLKLIALLQYISVFERSKNLMQFKYSNLIDISLYSEQHPSWQQILNFSPSLGSLFAWMLLCCYFVIVFRLEQQLLFVSLLSCSTFLSPFPKLFPIYDFSYYSIQINKLLFSICKTFSNELQQLICKTEFNPFYLIRQMKYWILSLYISHKLITLFSNWIKSILWINKFTEHRFRRVIF